jgi:fluoroacetyl-CoA thioesterase
MTSPRIPEPLVAGRTGAIERTVTEDDTAAAVGSGSLPVLGTPVLLAWCEAATCETVAPCLVEGQTTVGTRVSIEHLAPSAVGAVVRITTGVTHVDGRLVRFSVAARQAGRLVGSGEITRVVVDAEKFLARVTGG